MQKHGSEEEKIMFRNFSYTMVFKTKEFVVSKQLIVFLLKIQKPFGSKFQTGPTVKMPGNSGTTSRNGIGNTSGCEWGVGWPTSTIAPEVYAARCTKP